MLKRLKTILALMALQLFGVCHAIDYRVGPEQPLAAIGDVPWANLQAGDRVFIHWRATPYNEKWVINAVGTEENPIQVIGVNGPQGQQPVIDGNAATTVPGVNFWNERRGLIKIGGSNTPSNAIPEHIIIENLDLRSARPPFQFTNDGGGSETYSNNAASVYVEIGQHITIRNNTIRDSGNGIFVGANGGQTQDILIQNNHIYDNGIEGRIFEHNTYTAAIGIIYEGNRFGPLRTGALGNNLKDRSAGLVVRNNWIKDGNRQLDLVDAEDSSVLVNHPSYATTHVYGNVLIESEGEGNSQMVHYGGDSGTTSDYRKGDLYFYNNTVFSSRSGNTTLMRLSTNDETAHVFNNVYYGTAAGSNQALIDGNGMMNIQHNWFKTGWQDCHCSPNGSINDLGNVITGSDPGFIDLNNLAFGPLSDSELINQGMAVLPELLPEYALAYEYLKHQATQSRIPSGAVDIGAYEFCGEISCDLIFENGFD
ncbi:right-handed parallel beta-helix repeat-containing protein [Marinicella sp. S1101]|uniref:right-handed parallel beta-helix repeat-containing protein n=1 Tax=Marinicella marina TaxID=2996016 RepID=UPI002260FBA1|nr:right-handed parallel beta-helix repeat-containing protein [Marinicella marina]MCX7553601.1 right-handed parallel beta-helix repeat-containing protein [Marinicella marina]MDJ1140225.1 right-handed parallel beta-helix repeat-containing protein [Marinicella marina]